MLPEHGQLMQYDVQDTSTSSYTHGSATGMVRWQPLCRICTRLHAARAESAARRQPRHAWHRLVQPSLAAPVAASLSAIIAGLSLAAGAAGKTAGGSYYMCNVKSEHSRDS